LAILLFILYFNTFHDNSLVNLLFILYFNTFHDNSLVNKIKLLSKVSKYYLYYKIAA
jgi:hypothetical protein